MSDEGDTKKNRVSSHFDASSPAKEPGKASSLQIEIEQNVANRKGGSTVVKLSGSLNTATAPELERRLSLVLSGTVKDLVFDLAHLKFISSAGLRVFSMARKQIKERGGQTAFMNMQPQIKEVFAIIKALPGVAVFQDVAEFDAYIAARQKMHEEKE